jgi:hypothetical protein
MDLPAFKTLSANFPDYWRYPTPDAARKYIGGETLDKDITNTCTIRMSHAMNASGAPVPKVWQTITNREGRNKQYYIIRVVNFRAWMEHMFGPPDLTFTKKAGDKFQRHRLEGNEGVIAFDIGFTDATGHFDLWYRDKFSHEDNGGQEYLMRAKQISLWTGGTVWSSPEV